MRFFHYGILSLAILLMAGTRLAAEEEEPAKGVPENIKLNKGDWAGKKGGIGDVAAGITPDPVIAKAADKGTQDFVKNFGDPEARKEFLKQSPEEQKKRLEEKIQQTAGGTIPPEVAGKLADQAAAKIRDLVGANPAPPSTPSGGESIVPSSQNTNQPPTTSRLEIDESQKNSYPDAPTHGRVSGSSPSDPTPVSDPVSPISPSITVDNRPAAPTSAPATNLDILKDALDEQVRERNLTPDAASQLLLKLTPFADKLEKMGDNVDEVKKTLESQAGLTDSDAQAVAQIFNVSLQSSSARAFATARGGDSKVSINTGSPSLTVSTTNGPAAVFTGRKGAESAFDFFSGGVVVANKKSEVPSPQAKAQVRRNNAPGYGEAVDITNQASVGESWGLSPVPAGKVILGADTRKSKIGGLVASLISFFKGQEPVSGSEREVASEPVSGLKAPGTAWMKRTWIQPVLASATGALGHVEWEEDGGVYWLLPLMFLGLVGWAGWQVYSRKKKLLG